MSATAEPAILYEHPECFSPRFQALERQAMAALHLRPEGAPIRIRQVDPAPALVDAAEARSSISAGSSMDIPFSSSPC